ncbi:NUDIX hydrolase [Thermogladius sp.]|uniref:NUDIX hydrolase n=1 Tax=Thermogladius sp. TaxID=2023064 RepID=UPI003D0A3122
MWCTGEVPKVLEEQVLFRGLRFDVVRRHYAYGSRRFARDVVVFPESSVVVPFVNDEEVIVIRQFRAPLGEYIVEVPAGVLDKGESPEEAARRELVEETGFYPRKLTRLATVYPVPGYSTEVMHVFEAEELEFKGAKPEPHELIEVVRVPFREVLVRVLRGEIRDAKTVIGVLLAGYRRGLLGLR